MSENKKLKNSSADPKTTALAHLGISIGSKNMKTLRKDEVDAAFISQFIGSVQLPDTSGPVCSKFGSKKQYQRILHESYQFLIKFIDEQHNLEMARRKKLA